MATLKGQNLRILAAPIDAHTDPFVIAMATNCTITMTNNSQDAYTKDDVGMANKPQLTTKSWQVQVESLNVADMGSMLGAIKRLEKFTLLWDETSTTDNKTPSGADFQRIGLAYLSEGTFTFNDRENAGKNLTFIGSEAFEHDTQVSTTSTSAASYSKGQFTRLYLSSDNTETPNAVIAYAKNLSFHVALQMQDATTKDTEGDFQYQEPVSLSYDFSTSALVDSGESIESAVAGKTLNDLESIYEGNIPVKWQIANTSGLNNRTKGTVIVSGSAIINSLSINAAVRTVATYEAQFGGYGDYTVGA